jgi:hypothetical protein
MLLVWLLEKIRRLWLNQLPKHNFLCDWIARTLTQKLLILQYVRLKLALTRLDFLSHTGSKICRGSE